MLVDLPPSLYIICKGATQQLLTFECLMVAIVTTKNNSGVIHTVTKQREDNSENKKR